MDIRYTQTFEARGLHDEQRLDFNRAWGFEDGRCNTVVEHGDGFEAKPGVTPAYLEAERRACRGLSVRVEITLHRDGSKSARVVS